ncbi:hypothetical protein BLNAU_475 [Blattamonas nauphoetae]|uniref:Uncharacterized protein n=1 Tax=Blattamonas nauphoetae TaxID=2049346 RepID=A0ABQ9YLC5_9EUKA|nr:hypothetical protein BLNAU_475 [Blattamonas nauphoetae]
MKTEENIAKEKLEAVIRRRHEAEDRCSSAKNSRDSARALNKEIVTKTTKERESLSKSITSFQNAIKEHWVKYQHFESEREKLLQKFDRSLRYDGVNRTLNDLKEVGALINERQRNPQIKSNDHSRAAVDGIAATIKAHQEHLFSLNCEFHSISQLALPPNRTDTLEDLSTPISLRQIITEPSSTSSGHTTITNEMDALSTSPSSFTPFGMPHPTPPTNPRPFPKRRQAILPIHYGDESLTEMNFDDSQDETDDTNTQPSTSSDSNPLPPQIFRLPLSMTRSYIKYDFSQQQRLIEKRAPLLQRGMEQELRQLGLNIIVSLIEDQALLMFSSSSLIPSMLEQQDPLSLVLNDRPFEPTTPAAARLMSETLRRVVTTPSHRTSTSSNPLPFSFTPSKLSTPASKSLPLPTPFLSRSPLSLNPFTDSLSLRPLSEKTHTLAERYNSLTKIRTAYLNGTMAIEMELNRLEQYRERWRARRKAEAGWEWSPPEQLPIAQETRSNEMVSLSRTPQITSTANKDRRKTVQFGTSTLTPYSPQTFLSTHPLETPILSQVLSSVSSTLNQRTVQSP